MIKTTGKPLVYVGVLAMAYALFSGICTYSFSGNTFLEMALGSLPIFLALLFSLRYLWRLIKNNSIQAVQKFLFSVPADNEQISFLIVFLVTCLLFMPAYFALFPGTFGYDAPIQMYSYAVEHRVTSHHPVLHTFLMSEIITSIGKRFNNYNVGLAVFSLLQGMILAHAVSKMYVYMRRRGLSVVVSGWLYLCVVLNPNIQILAFNTTKDVLFSAFFLEFIIALFYLFEDCNERHVKRKRWLIYEQCIFWGILFCLFRSQGIIIIFLMLLLSLCVKKYRTRGLGAFAPVFIISLAFQLLCSEVIGIQKVDAREMYSIPMQQVARVAKKYLEYEDGICLSEEQLAVVEEVIPEDGIRAYMEEVSDPVKSVFRTNVLNEDTAKYLTVYFDIGIQNTREYVEATLYMIAPYLDMRLNQYGYLTSEDTFQQLNVWGIEKHSLWPAYHEYLYDMVVNQMYGESFLLNLVFNPGTTVWIGAALVLYGMLYRKRKFLFLSMPLLLYFLTALLGPMALVRYAMPMMCVMPALTGYFLLEIRDDPTLHGAQASLEDTVGKSEP